MSFDCVSIERYDFVDYKCIQEKRILGQGRQTVDGIRYALLQHFGEVYTEVCRGILVCQGLRGGPYIPCLPDPALSEVSCKRSAG